MVPVPLEVTDVTAEWLSAVLATPVQAVEVLAAHSGTTGRARLGLRCGPDEGDPVSVFVKLAPFDERQRRFVDRVGLGVAEARFYRDVASLVPVRVPRVFHAALDGSGYVMVLEDLVRTGVRFPRPDDGELDEFVARLLDELARLHASFWAAPELTDGSLAFVGDGARLAFGAGGSFIRHAVEHFAADLPPVFAELGARYVADAPAIAALWELEPHTLAHGDAHLGNLFVDGDRPGFFDWAMVMPRAGMWDVAYVLCGSVPRDVRRAHETEWIARYCAALDAAGVHLDEAKAWEQYRLFAVYAWVSATSTAGVGTRFQRADVAFGGMTRATAAVDDLDSLGALSARLTARS